MLYWRRSQSLFSLALKDQFQLLGFSAQLFSWREAFAHFGEERSYLVAS